MQKKQFKLIAKEISSSYHNLDVRDKLIFLHPTESILRGILFDGSSFDKTSFYVSWFALPLFVPTDQLYLNFGDRVLNDGADRWNVEQTNFLGKLKTEIYDQALKTLYNLGSTDNFLLFIELNMNKKDPYVLRAIAYSLAKLGRTREAIEEIELLQCILDISIPWQANLSNEVAQFRQKLVSDPRGAENHIALIENDMRKFFRLK